MQQILLHSGAKLVTILEASRQLADLETCFGVTEGLLFIASRGQFIALPLSSQFPLTAQAQRRFNACTTDAHHT